MASSDKEVRLHKSFSLVQERLNQLFNHLGVKPSFSVPYVHGEAADAHINAVGAAAQQVGGLTRNLITTFHHEGGRGFNTGDGRTVGHPAAKLRETVIPKNSKPAIAVIDAAKAYLRDIEKLLGKDDPDVQTAMSQLKLVEQTDGEGMTAQDFGIYIINIMKSPTQAVSRKHTLHKHGRVHPPLTAPQEEGEQAAPEAAPAAAPAAPAAPAQ